MAGLTPRFSLNYFGNDVDGNLSDDNDKFTGEDRLTVDRLLATIEKHTHHRQAVLAEVGDPLDLSVDTGGDLDAGETYYYCVAIMDANGLETPAGPESSIDTADILPEPDPPSAETSTASGSLTPGQYYYAITGLRGEEESALSDPVSVTVLDDEDTVTLTLPALGDATSYQIWRMRDIDADYTRIGTSTIGSFIDDGSVPSGTYGDPGNIPPSDNIGIGQYAITITLSTADATKAQAGSGWRIYRSTTSGAYGAASLVHEVIERTDELDPASPLLTTWTDTGDALLTGSPKLFSTQLDFVPFTLDYANPLPSPTAYPDKYPILGPGNVLYAKLAGTWTSIGGGGGGGGSIRGVAVFTGTGAPAPEPGDGLAGDLYIDLSTGDLYTLEGTPG